MKVRSPFFTASVCATAVWAAACGGPSAQLEVSPTEGQAPLLVTLDASKSSGPEGLLYRFDFDGDGEFDTEFDEGAIYDRSYESAGEFVPRVEVQAPDGSTSVFESPVSITVSRADIDIDADVNRDGEIDDADKNLEGSFSAERGAVFWANLDDDDGDGSRDAADNTVDGAGDLDDLARLVLRQSDAVQSGDRLNVRVTPSSAARFVRIFEQAEDGNINELIAPSAGSGGLDASRIADGEVTLFLEGLSGRADGFDGDANVTVELVRDGEVQAEDRVRLRGAPIIFPDDTLPAERLYLMSIVGSRNGDNQPFVQAVQRELSADIQLFNADQDTYFGDRWLQDNMQTGYQLVPRANGETQLMPTYLATERITGYGLEFLVPNELLGTDFGFTYPGGSPSSLNYGGNLEVSPPMSHGDLNRPFGQLLVGGGDLGTVTGRPNADFMTGPQLRHLEAQQVQAPAIELSSEWLAVGHIDEIFLFVPDQSRPEKPWRVVIASPDLARAALEDLQADGQGSAAVFAGRRNQTTASAILLDDELLAYNDAVQVRIDLTREVLVEAFELNDEDFVEVPVLYEVVGFGGRDFAAAYNPGIQNLIITDDVLFIPDPEGPDSGGEDIWQRLVRDGLEPMGQRVVFVDVFESYHELLGEAHCGSNVRRTPHATPWWQVEVSQ